MQIFEVQNLTYYYPNENDAALRDISLTVQDGELIFLAGYSGSGKSSLLKTMAGLLPEFYGGKIGGSVKYNGKDMREWDKRQISKEIGIVFQDPEQQTCMTVVEHEVAFGLENLGIPRDEMRHRVAEVLAMLDLTGLKDCSIFELSNGQKQRVILASVLAMYPRVLILDEPTSQLDPIAANQILDYVYRLNREWGTTIILSEQRVERCFDMADRMITMDEGRVIFDDIPRKAIERQDKIIDPFLPPISKIFMGANLSHIPISVKEGRRTIKDLNCSGVADLMCSKEFVKDNIDGAPALVSGRRIGYTYPSRDFTLDNIDFQFYGCETTTILGENGAGKSTLLKLISGILKPQKGRITIEGDVGYLSQNPNDYLFCNTLYEQLLFALQLKNMEDDGRIDRILKELYIHQYRDKNPRDLSGGEKQRVAIATVMVTDPSIVLMDEPTRGIDSSVKDELALIIKSLASENRSVIIVTHDIEFAADVSQKILLMADGAIVAGGEMHKMVGSSFYYSTQVSRLFRDIDPKIVKVEEGINFLNKITCKGCM